MKKTVYELKTPFLIQNAKGTQILPSGFKFFPQEDGDTYVSLNKQSILSRRFIEKHPQFFAKVELADTIFTEVLEGLTPVEGRVVFRHRRTGAIKILKGTIKELIENIQPLLNKEYDYVSYDINTLTKDLKGDYVYTNDIVEDENKVQYIVLYDGEITMKSINIEGCVFPSISYLIKTRRISTAYINETVLIPPTKKTDFFIEIDDDY